MKFSFVIPSYNRKRELQQCILSIENAYEFARNLDNVEIEILIIFCGVNIDKSSLDLKFPELTITQYLEENIVCRAKNVGIEMACGKFVILIDDDATLKEDFFVQLNNVIHSNVNIYCAKLMDPQTHECFTKKETSLARKYLGRLDYNFFRGSALIIEKSILKRAGLFDEEFGPGGTYFSAEESDLFFRIKMLKEDVLFVPEVIVYHPTGAIVPGAKVFKYSYATGAMLTKYCFDDLVNIHAYVFLISRILLICVVRIVQMTLFPGTMALKNQQHRYLFVIKGLTMGIWQYFRKMLFSRATNNPIR